MLASNRFATSALLVLALSSSIATSILAAETPVNHSTQELTQQQWGQDIDVLESSIRALHPGLYSYNTPTQVDRLFADLSRRIERDPRFPSAFVAISEAMAELKCGHTYTNFGNQERSTKERLFSHQARVPFLFRWIDGRMIITRNASNDTSLVPGTEVLSINDVPSKRILKRLMAIGRADGSNDAKRVDYLQVQGLAEHEAFDIYLPLYFPEIGKQQKLRVRYPNRPGLHTVTVSGLDHAQRQALVERRSVPSGNDPADWTVTYPDADSAVLKLTSWALYNTKWDWRAYLDGVFRELESKGTRRLVIDIRGNEGGLGEVGDHLIAHLIDRETEFPRIERRTAYRKVPDALVPNLSTWDRSFKDWGEQAQEMRPGVFRLVRPNDATGPLIIRPVLPRFLGKTIVLTSATNSSAAFEFIQRVKSAKLATLIGQPTGGNQRGINGGAFFFLTLPNSRIEIDLPLIAQLPTTEAPDAGIQPDILVKLRATDIAKGHDAVMAAALSFPVPPASQATSAFNAAEAIENELIPAVIFVGEPVPKLRLTDRMRKYQVPAVSIAGYTNDGESWYRVHGRTHGKNGSVVHMDTLFQAASISKTVTAIAVQILAAQRGISLDEDVKRYLTSWRIPRNPFSAEPITLRQLLSHTAGISVEGVKGEDLESTQSTLQEMLNGANGHLPVEIAGRPGNRFSYSGGGYLILQQFVEDVSGMPFGDYVKRVIFHPLNMSQSRYEDPDPSTAALAHGVQGATPRLGWYRYPQHAAAGLWSTPADLLKLVRSMQNSFHGNGGLLSREQVNQMLAIDGPQGYGLGVGVKREPIPSVFFHAGQNPGGYSCVMVGRMDRNEALVVMTNSEDPSLLREIISGYAERNQLGDVHGLHQRPVSIKPHPIRRDTLQMLSGSYADPDDGYVIYVSIAENNRLRLTYSRSRREFELIAISESRFVDLQTGSETIFDVDPHTGKGLRLLRSGDTFESTPNDSPNTTD